jgi:hypothetical protein
MGPPQRFVVGFRGREELCAGSASSVLSLWGGPIRPSFALLGCSVAQPPYQATWIRVHRGAPSTVPQGLDGCARAISMSGAPVGSRALTASGSTDCALGVSFLSRLGGRTHSSGRPPVFQA